MNESAKMSRRDWFRLRRPDKDHGENLATEKSSALSSSGLKPIAHPPNHDGLDLTELPPMREAILSREQVADLFSDVGKLATDVLLMRRGSDSMRATVTKANTEEQLELAKAALLSGAVSRVQVRYSWQASQWIDTLQVQDGGYRLVRIMHRPS